MVMNFLLGGRTGNDRSEEWLEYFDVVICGRLLRHLTLVVGVRV